MVRLRSKLEHLLYKAHRVRGYEPVRGPEILKAECGKYLVIMQTIKRICTLLLLMSKSMGIKPMNCVGHIQIFKMI